MELGQGPAADLGVVRWVLDLDGVMWRGSEPIAGSASAVSRLVEVGHQVIFCTNHATAPEIKIKQLADFGVPDAQVLTSAEVAAAACRPTDKVLCLGEESLKQVLQSAGLDVTDVGQLPPDGPVGDFDVVIVGSTPDWDRSRAGLVADAIRQGASFLATNADPTYPFTGANGPRLLPGAGALVAAVGVAAGQTPKVMGKPHPATVELILARYGRVDYVVGDRPDTDGALAIGLNAGFALVLSGVTATEDLPGDPPAQLVGRDLSHVVDQVLGA
ncbi:MAG: HAD-IIA family hydrolase [Microthrixaceae bacterium]